jgi:hypothetical protein
MSSVKLTKDEIKTILTTLDRFPEVDHATIVTTQTGIGTTLEVVFDTTINGISGVFKVDLTDESKW